MYFFTHTMATAPRDDIEDALEVKAPHSLVKEIEYIKGIIKSASGLLLDLIENISSPRYEYTSFINGDAKAPLYSPTVSPV